MSNKNPDNFLKGLESNSNKIKVTAQKVIQKVQYEPERFESELEIVLEEPLIGIERMVIVAALRAQNEYGLYYHLYKRKLVTKEELEKIKEINSDEVEQLVTKAKRMGINVERLMELAGIEYE